MKINNIFILSLMLFSLAFDYRTSVNSSKLFIVILSLLSLLSGLFLIYKIKYLYKKSTAFIFIIILFILTTSISGFIHGQTTYQVFSAEIPLLIFLISFIVISSFPLYKKNLNLNKMIHTIFYFMFISVIFKLLFGFYYYGLTLSSVRYEIISPVLILLFSYGITSLLYSKQKYGLLALSLALTVAFLSVTRTFLLVFLIIGILWIFILPLTYWVKNLKKVFNIIFLFSILFVLFSIIFPEMLERWIIRLFVSAEEQGIDVTYITRIAESTNQLSQLSDNMTNLLIGLGIYGETGFSEEYRKMLNIVFSDDFVYVGHGFGHNTYVGSIFVSGIVVGSIFIYTILLNIKNAIKLMKYKYKANLYMSNKNIQYNKQYFFILAWGTSSALGYAIYALLAGLFGDRLYSLSFGISFGLIFLGKRLLEKKSI